MAELMLINPRKRRRSPAKKKTVARRTPKKRASPVRRRKAAQVTRRRRNPIGAKKTLMNSQITPAFVAASGALGLDVALGLIPIPETLKTGPFKYLVKGAGAIALGMLAANVVGRKTGEQMATGALTVVMHGAMKEVAQNAMPNLNLGYYNAGHNVGVGEYLSGVDAYVPDSDQSPYLSDSLATPFAGKSSAQAAEARIMQECQTSH